MSDIETTDVDMFTIGNNLRELREQKRVTQMQVVDVLGVSYTHYAKIEEGMRGMSLKMLIKLIRYFETDANTILGSARRREKKKQRMARQENIPCIVFLATDEESFELAEKKEDRQLRYINQYADAHGLIPMKIVRKSCFAPYVVNQMYSRCIDWMQQGKAEAILVANMEYLALDEEDAYRKVGQVRKAGFRIFSVDDGELKMNIRFRAEKERKIG